MHNNNTWILAKNVQMEIIPDLSVYKEMQGIVSIQRNRLNDTRRKSDKSRMLLLLLSRFSCVRLCATPLTAAHQAPPSLGFSRQEQGSGLPFPSPMHESEKRKWSRVRLFATPWTAAYQAPPSMDFPGKSTRVGCHCLLRKSNEDLNYFYTILQLFINSSIIPYLNFCI